MEDNITPIVSLLDQLKVSEQVKIESRNREVHLPPVSVYRWWARRTSAVNSAIIEAAEQAFQQSGGLKIADPFCGGGIIPMTALQRGHSVYAQDLNPWVTHGLSTALSLPSAEDIENASKVLLAAAKPVMNRAYSTTFSSGDAAYVSQTFRVAIGKCPDCGTEARLFPHALISRLVRKDRKKANPASKQAFIACKNGHLYKGNADKGSRCPECHIITQPDDVYLSKRVHKCMHCQSTHSLDSILGHSNPRWEIVLVERSMKSRREIAIPTKDEITQAELRAWKVTASLGDIPEAHETKVLLRHGFKTFKDLYPARQYYVMRHIIELIESLNFPAKLKNALRMAIWGTAEMAGHLSRWDRHYLKSYESMASHRFNFTTFTAEPNIVGLDSLGRGSLVNRIQGLKKAAIWLGDQKIDLPLQSPIDANHRKRRQVPSRRMNVVCGSSERMLLADGSVDLILTDPPYHDDVQYHELSLPFRAWAGLSMERAVGEAVAIPKSDALQGHKSYRDQLIPIFTECARVLQPNGRLVFSYANREPAAWVNLFAALKAAKLKPLGFTIVHSENETESGKSRRRTCNLDLVMELAQMSAGFGRAWAPTAVLHTDEETYLLAVGKAFLKSSTLVNGWEQDLVEELKSELFLTEAHQSASVDEPPKTEISAPIQLLVRKPLTLLYS